MENSGTLMYERYYGLRERPFDLTPNPRFLFLTAKHREALSHLEYALSRRAGITVLTGEAGTGKTTLVHAALDEKRGQDACTVYMSNPLLTRQEFFEFLAWGFKLDFHAEGSKTRFLLELTQSLVDRQAAGGTSALIIDEAHCLSHELLEEIRLLANIETAADKLLPVVLVGQPELADRLNEPSLRQLKQRVALRCELTPLSLSETASYIAARIRVAGGETARVFTREAVALIHERSGGIPRVISVVCDNALVTGFALDRRPVTSEIVIEVCRDFDLDARLAAGAGELSFRATPQAATVEREAVASVAPATSVAVAGAPARKRMFSFF
jgi:general secretion pathway protein A